MAVSEGFASSLGHMVNPDKHNQLVMLTRAQVLFTSGRMEDWIEAWQLIGFEEMPPLAGREIRDGLAKPIQIDMEQVADGRGLWQEGELPDLFDHEDDEDELDELSGWGEIQARDEADDFLADNGYDVNGELIEDNLEFDQDMEVQERFELAELKAVEKQFRMIVWNDCGQDEVTCWKAYHRTQYRPSTIAAQSKAQVAKQQALPSNLGWYGYGMLDRSEVDRPETDGFEDVEAWMDWHEAGLPFNVLFEQEMLEFNEPFIDRSDPDFDHDWDWHYRDRSMAWEDFDEYDDDDWDLDDDDLDDWDRMDDDWGDPYADGLNNEWPIDDNSWEDDFPYDFWDEEDLWDEYDIRRSWGFGKGSGREQLSLEYFRQKHPRVEDLQEEFELEEIRVEVRESHDSYRLWQEECGGVRRPWSSWKYHRRSQYHEVINSVPRRESARHTKAIPISQADDFDDQLFDDLTDLEEAA